MSGNRPNYIYTPHPVLSVHSDDDLFEMLYCHTDVDKAANLGYADPSSMPSLIELQVKDRARRRNLTEVPGHVAAGGDASEAIGSHVQKQNIYRSKHISGLMVHYGLVPTRKAQCFVQLISLLVFLLLLVALHWVCKKYYKT